MKIIRNMEQSKVPDSAPGVPSVASVMTDPWIGRLVAKRFRVDLLIGAGGMSTVYKARDLSLGRDVAIKVMLPKLNASQSNLLRFQKEAQALSILNHDNIVRVWEYGIIEDNIQYMVMEYISGTPLSEVLLSEGTLTIERTIAIVNQICNALAHAHTHNIVHRDLKPGNVVLESAQDKKDHVKIIDFGIAKLISESGMQNLTSTGEVFGSPFYMSPEQCGGLQVDKRSDIYSLGCIMYECLAGMPPFIGETPLATLMKHQQDKPLSLKQATLGKSFPAVLEKIVERMLQKRPEDRYQLAEELQLDLDRLKNIDWSDQDQANDLGLAHHPAQFSTLLPLQVVQTAMPAAEKRKPVDRRRQLLVFGSLLVALVIVSIVAGPHLYKMAYTYFVNASIFRDAEVQHKAERISAEQKPGFSIFSDTTDLADQVMKNDNVGIAVDDSGPYAVQSSNRAVSNPKDWAKVLTKKDLQILELSNTEVTDAQVATLSKLPLRYLDLSGCGNVTVQGIKSIEHIPTLQAFDFSRRSGSPNEACAHLNPNLVDLRLSNVDLNDDAVKTLLRLKRLRRLDLRFNYLTDKSLKVIQQMKNLDSLDLRGNSGLTWAGLGALSRAMPNCVVFVNSNVDDHLPNRQGSPNAFFRERGLSGGAFGEHVHRWQDPKHNKSD